MIEFNVINYDANSRQFKSYNVIPYLVKCFKKFIPKTFEEAKEFIEKEAHYQWWARCEYEIILSSWPSQRYSEKWDIYRQIKMNLDIITKLVLEELGINI